MSIGDNMRSREVVSFLLVALVVSVIGFAMDRLLMREGLHRIEIIALSNSLTGVVAGLLYLQVTRVERERRAATQERLRTIADMNHHIRNALQIIAYASSAADRSESVELVRSSVERIEWALREVLPGHAVSELPLPRPTPSDEYNRKSEAAS